MRGPLTERAHMLARHSSGSWNPVFCSWIPGLALLARNDGLVVFVLPAKAGIQARSTRLYDQVSLCLYPCQSTEWHSLCRGNDRSRQTGLGT